MSAFANGQDQQRLSTSYTRSHSTSLFQLGRPPPPPVGLKPKASPYRLVLSSFRLPVPDVSTLYSQFVSFHTFLLTSSRPPSLRASFDSFVLAPNLMLHDHFFILSVVEQVLEGTDVRLKPTVYKASRPLHFPLSSSPTFIFKLCQSLSSLREKKLGLQRGGEVLVRECAKWRGQNSRVLTRT